MKKSFILTSIMFAFIAASVPAIAETTIYTDGIGRIHFLGKNPGETTQYNYSNPEQQDLTRRLYENSTGDINYVDHPLKNYENTFSDSRFNTTWKQKYRADIDGEDVSVSADKKVKGSFTAVKGATQEKTNYVYDSVNNVEESANNVIKNTKTKKHWWNK